MIKLILTSDDFGMSKVYNEKIIEMIQLGFLSSVSIMVERENKEQLEQFHCITQIYKNGALSVGLHLEIKESDIIKSCEGQWDEFEKLLGFSPTYIDVHKGHLIKEAFNVIAEYCLRKNVFFRKYKETTVLVGSPKSSLIATNKDLNTVQNWISAFEDGSTHELIFHVGMYDPNCKSNLNREREKDIENLKLIYNYIQAHNIFIVNYESLRTD